MRERFTRPGTVANLPLAIAALTVAIWEAETPEPRQGSWDDIYIYHQYVGWCKRSLRSMRQRTDDSSTAGMASDQVVMLGGLAVAPVSARARASREAKENIFVEGGRKQSRKSSS